MSTSTRKQQLVRSTIASIAGTTIEWYDYFLYGALAAIVFNKVFFPDLDPATGTIASFGTFAVGFLFRPFGAAFFGYLGDKVGRKSALLWTLIVMGVGTVGIGLLPNFHVIGLWAPVLLTLLRVLQGFAAGGEWGGAVLLTFENGSGVKRGLIAALPGVGVGLGSLLSTGFVAVMTAIVSPEAFVQWGWRVPFLASSVIIAVGIYIRLSIEETHDFKKTKAVPDQKIKIKSPLVELIRKSWRELLIVIGARVGENGCYYLFGTFVAAYAVSAKLPVPTVLAAVSLAFAIEIVAVPFFGWLSDRLGLRTVYGFGALFLVVWSWIFFRMLNTGDASLIFVAIVFGIVLAHSAMAGAQPAFFAQLFGVEVRYTGFALGHAVGAIIGGGLAPMIAAALLKMNNGDPTLVSAYACVMGVITLFTLLVSRRYLNRKRDSDDHELIITSAQT